MVDTGSSLLGETVAALEKFGVLVVHERSEISTIVKDQIELSAVLERDELLLNTPEVFLLGLTLPRVNGDTRGSNGRSLRESQSESNQLSNKSTIKVRTAWSWVEKMLQDDQVTSAPRAVRVSIRTAVWIVMCKHPAIRAPLRG